MRVGDEPGLQRSEGSFVRCAAGCLRRVWYCHAGGVGCPVLHGTRALARMSWDPCVVPCAPRHGMPRVSTYETPTLPYPVPRTATPRSNTPLFPSRCCLSDTIQLLRCFDHVLWVCCNPSSLAAALPNLDQHEVVRFAVLDHFPYTSHLEVALYLRRRAKEES